MKIFICGFSRSGKTSLASLLSKELDLVSISASGWLKAKDEVRTGAAEGETKQEYINRVTEMSIEYLGEDPNCCLTWIQKQHKWNIIEGLRNPRDFAYLYDPSKDIVLWTRNAQVGGAATEFERAGLCGILNYINFQKILFPDLKMITIDHNGPPDGLENVLEDVLVKIGAKKVWKLK